MKVYIVKEICYECSGSAQAVFSSTEKAELFVSRTDNEYFIVECEVDKLDLTPDKYVYLVHIDTDTDEIKAIRWTYVTRELTYYSGSNLVAIEVIACNSTNAISQAMVLYNKWKEDKDGHEAR